jgi:phosphoribosyl-AMP cyclohydrolase
MSLPLANLKFDANGLIPAIIQQSGTGQVLMMAWMNAEALRRTVETGRVHFFSRSRNKLWVKGETSGHWQTVKSIRTDCDADVLLIEADQVGAACHEGYASCFFRELKDENFEIVEQRLVDPDSVYRRNG